MCFELAILFTEAIWNSDREAAAAGTLTAIFRVPRGQGQQGLSEGTSVGCLEELSQSDDWGRHTQVGFRTWLKLGGSEERRGVTQMEGVLWSHQQKLGSENGKS